MVIWHKNKYAYFCRTSERNFVAGPSSADSANSHQGDFSRVQTAKGMAAKRKEKKKSRDFENKLLRYREIDCVLNYS